MEGFFDWNTAKHIYHTSQTIYKFEMNRIVHLIAVCFANNHFSIGFELSPLLGVGYKIALLNDLYKHFPGCVWIDDYVTKRIYIPKHRYTLNNSDIIIIKIES